MNAEQKSIEFYNDFVDSQRQTGIGDRIYLLYKRMLRLGLKSDSNVLELGCGIGGLTYLLSKKVRHGKIEAVDMSPKSIEFAKGKIKHPHITFKAANVVHYFSALKHFDFICLFDVIEHIPIEEHETLFRNVSNQCGSKTKILINIPNPAYIEYDQINQPHLLQIIDQPIRLEKLLAITTAADLELFYFETYSIWAENDYQFLIFRKKEKFEEQFLSDKRSLFEKAEKKIWRKWLQFRHPYK